MKWPLVKVAKNTSGRRNYALEIILVRVLSLSLRSKIFPNQ